MIWKTISFALTVAVASAISPVVSKGNAFFVDNNRFYIRGVDYQPGGSSNLVDPLADGDTCKRDIAQFTDLGINTVRVYSVDNTANHDDCMKQLADAGIYVILDVNIPKSSIARFDNGCSYNSMYLEEVFATVKALSQYDNTLAFFAGNEVVNDDPSTAAARYVKAVVRDIKNFLKNNNYRQVLVGYSAADVSENRLQTADYFNCGDDPMARSDLFGYNDYSWCGGSTFQTSGYDQKVAEFSNYSIPLFLSEFGCIKPSPRTFSEIASIYSTDMSGSFSGGLVYEYSQEVSNYGLVEISSDGSSVSTLKDFDNLKSAYAKTKNPSGDGGYQSNLAHASCPPLSSSWNATDTLPDTPGKAKQFIRGDAQPTGTGFKAVTQWACIAGDNNNDPGSSNSTSSTTSGASSTASSSGKASSSSVKKKGGAAEFGVNWVNFVALLGVFTGATLI